MEASMGERDWAAESEKVLARVWGMWFSNAVQGVAGALRQAYCAGIEDGRAQAAAESAVQVGSVSISAGQAREVDSGGRLRLFRVGDRVRVVAGVHDTRGVWGREGVVSRVEFGAFIVDSLGQELACLPGELEHAPAPDVARAPEPPPVSGDHYALRIVEALEAAGMSSATADDIADAILDAIADKRWQR